MESYLYPGHYDLVTPDGKVTKIHYLSDTEAEATVYITGILPIFVGFQLDLTDVTFNLKSALAQLGLDSSSLEMHLDPKAGIAEVKLLLKAIGPIATAMLKLIPVGGYIGKLFAADKRRRVRDPEYLLRMFGRSDRSGTPLLSLGGMHGSDSLFLEKVEGRTVAYLSLLNGIIDYDDSIYGLLPTIAKGLCSGMALRELIRLHQVNAPDKPRMVKEGEILLVHTQPLHIATVYGMVVNELMPQGFKHTSANILQPDTTASGDIYELFGNSMREIDDIPLEFYTLEPHREHVFFTDRDQLQWRLEQPEALFQAFATAPPGPDGASVFVVKGNQMANLQPQDWISRPSRIHEFPGISHGMRQALMVERYIQGLSAYPFLKAIEDGLITSQGVLLTRYFPSPLLKRMLLADQVQRALRGIYFQYPSQAHGEFFSHEDRAMLIDLAKFAIPVYWVDERTQKILNFVQKPEKDSGMFVPLEATNTFLRATFFGIYGSNLIAGNLENGLKQLLEGVLNMRSSVNHPLLSEGTPLAMVTGGGPGVMEVGNRVAKTLNILSCANIVDFRPKDGQAINEQQQNSYIEAKMTYRKDKLVERQAEFHLDFPIFLQGGIGTDFEFALEEVRRKVGTTTTTPVLLFGEPSYWKEKITSRFKANLRAGTIAGSEWVSNSFFCVTKAEQGLSIYRDFFENRLPIGTQGPTYEDGFVNRSL